MATAIEETLGDGIVNKAPAGTHEPGEYIATVVEVKNDGPNKFNPEKDQFRFVFNLEDEDGEDRGSTSMWVNKSFGFSKLNGFSKLAQLVQALTGVPCGDPAQRQLRLNELKGLRINVLTERNERGYLNIKSFSPHVSE